MIRLNPRAINKTVVNLLLLLLSLTMVGCKETMYTNLSESEANQMLALLISHNLDAEKQTVNGKNVTLKVEDEQFSVAVELLKQNGFPREEFATVEQLFPQDGLVATPTQEKARFEYALSQSLAETLNQIDGVISARVHIVIPETKKKNEVSTSSAAVFIKHSQNTDVSLLTPEIKSLIQSSIEGLNYNNVKVVMVESSLPPPITLTSIESDNNNLLYIYIAVAIFMLLLIGMSLFLYFKLNNLKIKNQEILESVTNK